MKAARQYGPAYCILRISKWLVGFETKYVITDHYSHLRILIHRSSFMKFAKNNSSNQVVINAACRITRIAEDMSTQGTLRYGQMHL
jgi:hypothetical protein